MFQPEEPNTRKNEAVSFLDSMANFSTQNSEKRKTDRNGERAGRANKNERLSLFI